MFHHTPRMVAQRSAMEALQDSPLQATQLERWGLAFGSAASLLCQPKAATRNKNRETEASMDRDRQSLRGLATLGARIGSKRIASPSANLLMGIHPDFGAVVRPGAQRALGGNSARATVQRALDTSLKATLEEAGYTGPVNGQYMLRKGENMSPSAVNWKAHIGVKKPDREAVLKRVAPILISHKIEYKIDINDAKELPKFVTIYPPLKEEGWAPLLSELDLVLSGIGTLLEGSTKGVMGGGKIGMRHGQILALSKEAIQKAGIELIAKEKQEHQRGNIQYYDVQDKSKVWEHQQGRLAWVDFMHAFFFMTPQGPKAAVLWKGKLRADPRKEWNPFDIPLPKGVKTTEDLHQVLAAQEKTLTKLAANIALSKNRVWALYATEERSITSTDSEVITRRNFRINQEYGRLRTYRTQAWQAEGALQTLPPTIGESRRQTALRQVADIKITIAQLLRKLDVVF